jgi:hypothetical protein
MKLYEEVDMIENAINDILYGEEDIDIVALDNLMQAKTQTITNGLEALCKIRARKENDITALKAEATRMKEKAEREEKALLRLESYMTDMLKRSGEKKLTAGTFTVGTRESTSVWLSADFNVPEYMRTTTTTAPDKIAIKEALKNGVTIPGAALAVKENLAVK